MNSIRQHILEYLFSSIFTFRNDPDLGPEVFLELYFNRYNNRETIQHCIETHQNMTIVGGPGEGKTTLMHCMFTIMQKKKGIYPIILDLRQSFPRSEFGLIRSFVTNMKAYFDDINQPINTLLEPTHEGNYDLHYNLVSTHLQSIPLSVVRSSKTLAVFLDDLDYMDAEYVRLLRKYFLAYSNTEKAIFVLSGRKPLINSLQLDHELWHAFRMRPRTIPLQELDLESFINARIGSILPSRTFERGHGKHQTVARDPNVVRRLRNGALAYLIRKQLTPPKVEEAHFALDLGFPPSFYSYLADATGRNLALVEQLLPRFWAYECTAPADAPLFGTDFVRAFLRCAGDDRKVLLDIVSTKTTSRKQRHYGNAILQNVLEYFLCRQHLDQRFVDDMARLGIRPEEAKEAVATLSSPPFGLLEPDGLYQTNGAGLVHRFDITDKGRFYAKTLLTYDEYYDAIGKQVGEERVSRSSRSFAHEFEMQAPR